MWVWQEIQTLPRIELTPQIVELLLVSVTRIKFRDRCAASFDDCWPNTEAQHWDLREQEKPLERKRSLPQCKPLRRFS